MNNHQNEIEARKNNNRKAVTMSLNAINKIGTSKHIARAEHNAELHASSPNDVAIMPRAESPYIHSIETFSQYKYVCHQHTDWLADVHPEVTKLNYAFRKGYAREYIQIMIDKGYAPSSINRATCALAKMYRCTSNDIHDNRPKRCYIDFIRSRNYSEVQYQKDVQKYMDKYGPIVEICRITGVRELELENLYPECFNINANGDIYLHMDGKKQNTKGGKTRDIVIIPANQARIREILATLEPGKLICPIAPSHLDIHGIRSLYATDYYVSIARNPNDIPKSERIPLKHEKRDNSRPNQKRTSAPGVYRRRFDGKKFDRKAMLTVSRSLGHNREDVMIASYLR